MNIQLWTIGFNEVDQVLKPLLPRHPLKVCRRVLVSYLQALAIALLDLHTSSPITFTMRHEGVHVASLASGLRPLNCATGMKDTGESLAAARSRPGSAASSRKDIDDGFEDEPESPTFYAHRVRTIVIASTTMAH